MLETRFERSGERAPPRGVVTLDQCNHATHSRQCRLCHHAFDRAHQPLNQIDVVRCLIHECAAVEFPRATPWRLIVILLRTRPVHRAARQVNSAEPIAIDGALEQLDRRIEPVLLDDKELHSCLVAGVDERIGSRQRDRHRLLHHDMLARLRRFDALIGVQSRRSRNRYDVGLCVLEHLVDLARRHVLDHVGVLAH